MNNNNLVKNGQLTYYSRGFFSSKWKEGIFELYDNCVIKCYDADKSLICAVPLNTVSPFICVGKHTKVVPMRPGNVVEDLLMGFPRNYKRKPKDVIWIQFKNINELNDWTKLIFKLLPPKPVTPVGKKPLNSNQKGPITRTTYSNTTSSRPTTYSNSHHLYPVLTSGTVIIDHGCNTPHHHPHHHHDNDNDCHGPDHHHNHCDEHHGNHNHDHENCHESNHIPHEGCQNDSGHHDHHNHHGFDYHNDCNATGEAVIADYGDGGGWSNTDHGAFESTSTDYGIGEGWSSTTFGDGGGWTSSGFSSSDSGGFSSSDSGGFSSSDSGGFSSSDFGGFSSSDSGGFSSSDSGGFSSSDCGGFSSSD